MIDKLNQCLSLEKDLNLCEKFRDHEEWDSMCEIILLSCLEENLAIKLSADQLKSYSTIEEIFSDFIRP